MRTVETPAEVPSGAPETSVERSRPRTIAAALAGPALIVALTLFALRQFVFQPLLTNQHYDLLAFVLPRMSFLGRSLAAGHIPLWNPFDMTGTPYAADPQSAWLYGPPMLLFSLLSPGAAMRAFIAFNPLLAGLGMYGFLRIERISRPAATAGGLALALAMGASVIAISMPFAGTIAWTTVVLLAAAGFVGAERLSRRLVWIGLAAFAWSQVASAHLSHGLAMCTVLVATYLIAHAVRDARVDDRTGWHAALPVLAFLAVLPLADLAVFVPRIELLARSSLQGGYEALGEPLARVAGIVERPVATNGVWSGWPFGLGASPGAYVGAVTLLCAGLALRTRRHRALVTAFGIVGVVAYLLTLSFLVTADWFRSLVLQLPYGDVYLHNPGRLRYLLYLIVPALGAVGIQALIDRPIARKQLARWVAAGVVVWLGLPLLLGAHPKRYALLAIGIAAAIPALIALGERRRWALAVLVAALAVELTASVAYSQVYGGGVVTLGLEGGERPNLPPGPLRQPNVRQEAFLKPGGFVRFLRRHPDARYLTWVQPATIFVKGYLFTQEERDWPALANERGTLFGVRDVLGYNPVQLPRYWSYVRATNPDRLFLFYNASVINEPTLGDLRLLGARYLIIPQGYALPPTLSGRLVMNEAGYDLFEIAGSQSRVSVVTDWRRVAGGAAALRAVLSPGFDPLEQTVLETDAGLTPQEGAGRGTVVRVREPTPEDVRIQVDAPADSLVLVRTNWDVGWTATVDGREAPVLRANYLNQAVPIPGGRHEVRLSYRDPAVGNGLVASAVVWGLLVLATIAAAITERRRRASTGASGAAD